MQLEAKVKQQEILLAALLKSDQSSTDSKSVPAESRAAATRAMPTSCADLKSTGHLWNGVYSVIGTSAVETVYCDFTKPNTDPGQNQIGKLSFHFWHDFIRWLIIRFPDFCRLHRRPIQTHILLRSTELQLVLGRNSNCIRHLRTKRRRSLRPNDKTIHSTRGWEIFLLLYRKSPIVQPSRRFHIRRGDGKERLVRRQSSGR